MINNNNMNFTDGSDSYSNVLVYEDLCENITNHWLYLIFTDIFANAFSKS